MPSSCLTRALLRRGAPQARTRVTGSSQPPLACALAAASVWIAQQCPPGLRRNQHRRHAPALTRRSPRALLKQDRRQRPRRRRHPLCGPPPRLPTLMPLRQPRSSCPGFRPPRAAHPAARSWSRAPLCSRTPARYLPPPPASCVVVEAQRMSDIINACVRMPAAQGAWHDGTKLAFVGGDASKVNTPQLDVPPVGPGHSTTVTVTFTPGAAKNEAGQLLLQRPSQCSVLAAAPYLNPLCLGRGTPGPASVAYYRLVDGSGVRFGPRLRVALSDAAPPASPGSGAAPVPPPVPPRTVARTPVRCCHMPTCVLMSRAHSHVQVGSAIARVDRRT